LEKEGREKGGNGKGTHLRIDKGEVWASTIRSLKKGKRGGGEGRESSSIKLLKGGGKSRRKPPLLFSIAKQERKREERVPYYSKGKGGVSLIDWRRMPCGIAVSHEKKKKGKGKSFSSREERERGIFRLLFRRVRLAQRRKERGLSTWVEKKEDNEETDKSCYLFCIRLLNNERKGGKEKRREKRQGEQPGYQWRNSNGRKEGGGGGGGVFVFGVRSQVGD